MCRLVISVIFKYFRFLLPILFLLLMIVELLLLKRNILTLDVLIVLLWLLTVLNLRLGSSFSGGVALVLLLFVPLNLLFLHNEYAEEFASWTYVFIFFSALHRLFEIVKLSQEQNFGSPWGKSDAVAIKKERKV